MKYSIVIPTYNQCDNLLKPCIESIFEYTDTSQVEIIVVANGCTDNTKEFIESYKDQITLVWADEPLGYPKAVNLGIVQATGEFVILLNNDTVLLSQDQNSWLDMLSKPFVDPTVGICGPLKLFDNYANSEAIIFFCVMIRRELFDKVGLLDEIYSPGGGEDIDFSMKVKKLGYKIATTGEFEYSQEARTNVGVFPIWHKDNQTFKHIPKYTNEIVKTNGLINCKKYNKDIKLNLGAGGIEYPGYLSVDLYDRRAHIIMDITDLDFDENSVTEILASHVFEHLNPYHAFDILKKWLFVLKPGGKLVMEMPNIEELCRRFVDATTGERYGILNAVYGSVNTTDTGNPDDITSPHLFGWWPQSLYDHLLNAGYTDIEFMEEKIPHPESNFRVEALKPKTSLKQIDYQETNNNSMKILCSISTRGRYHTTLPLAILSAINQTKQIDKLIVFDDNDEPEDVRENLVYQNLFQMMDIKGIQWEWVFANKKGQHFNHQTANTLGYGFVWRLDDDNIADINVLEVLYSYIQPDVGAVGGAILTPPLTLDTTNSTGQIENIDKESNIQWNIIKRFKEVDHLHCSFLYRAGVHDYNLGLSRVAHREETLFTYGLKQKGYKILVVPNAITWHLKNPVGGIRSENQVEMYNHDEHIFQNNLKLSNNTIVVLDCGMGDHVVFKHVLPYVKNPLVFSSYPEIIPGKSIQEAKDLLGDIDQYNIYKKMDLWNWKDSLENAFRKLYRIDI